MQIQNIEWASAGVIVVHYVGADPTQPETYVLKLIDPAHAGQPARQLARTSEMVVAWSPDNAEIAYTALPEKSRAALVAVKATTGTKRALATPNSDGHTVGYLAWSKDGLLGLEAARNAADAPASLRLYAPPAPPP